VKDYGSFLFLRLQIFLVGKSKRMMQ
jgi:hypothetical protein